MEKEYQAVHSVNGSASSERACTASGWVEGAEFGFMLLLTIVSTRTAHMVHCLPRRALFHLGALLYTAGSVRHTYVAQVSIVVMEFFPKLPRPRPPKSRGPADFLYFLAVVCLKMPSSLLAIIVSAVHEHGHTQCTIPTPCTFLGALRTLTRLFSYYCTV